MTMRFGTDGVRGIANEDLTPEVALALGRAAVRVLGSDEWVIGRDTRASGPMLESAFAAGVCAEGSNVARLGVIPTPGVAYVAATRGLPGASITASHNPYRHNGIKVIGASGAKLAEKVEQEIEDEFGRLLATAATERSTPSAAPVGTVAAGDRDVQTYTDWLRSRGADVDLGSLGIALDCGNGAASVVGPLVFTGLGWDPFTLNVRPDGENINAACGSTDPSELQRLVADGPADVGFAFDGDADRVIAVDENGRLVDGDQIMAMLAIDWKQRSRLAENRVVVTEWSNLGFLRSMREHEIDVSVTAVGDRFVVEEMERSGAALGGEQSGHIVLSDVAPTGDGILTAIEVVRLMTATKSTLGDLADQAMRRLPQVAIVVNVGRPPKEIVAELRGSVEEANVRLGQESRLVLRASGTESVVRVMAESETEEEAASLVEGLSSLVQKADQPDARS